MELIKRNCEYCNRQFSKYMAPSKLARGFGKFCSQNCMGKSYWPKGNIQIE